MVVFGLLLTCLFGFLIIKMISPKIDCVTTSVLSFLLGLGLQTLIMFYLAILHIKLTFISVAVSMAIPIILMVFVLVLKKDLSWKFVVNLSHELRDMAIIFRSRMSIVEKIMTLIIVGIFFYVVIIGLYWPVFGWDSVALYDFRAKVFSSTGYMDDAIRRGYFFGYPLMTSMANTWVYLSNFGYPKFLYSFMYISLAILFYKFLRKNTTRILALVLTFIMMFSPPLFGHAAFDYTNMPYTVYFFISVIFLREWFNKKNNSYIVLSGLLMGLATWIRSTDPFWVINIAAILIAVVFMRRRFISLIIYLIAFIPIQQSWNIFLSFMSPNVSSQALVTGSVGFLLKGIDIVRLVKVLDFVGRVIGPILSPYVVLVTISFYFVRNRLKNNAFLYILLFGSFCILFLGAYLFSFIYPGWSAIGESLGRMVFIFIPLLVFTAGVNLGSFGGRRTHEKKRKL